MCTLIEIQPKRRLFAIAFFVDRGEEGRGIARQKLKYSHEMQIGENIQQLTSSVIRVDPSLRRVRLPLFVHTAANPYRVNRSNIFDRERFRNSSRRNDQTRAFVTKQQLSREISWKIIEGERERERKRERKKKDIDSIRVWKRDHPWVAITLLSVVGWKTVSIGLAVPETDDLPVLLIRRPSGRSVCRDVAAVSRIIPVYIPVAARRV